jgi:LmbE family N-acetylglucosaminyl deacetylase
MTARYKYLLLLLPGLVCLAIYTWGIVRPRPLLPSPRARDTVVFAAHSDDCAILAGEYGVASRRAGNDVHVVYLTCSDERPGSANANRRKNEAVKAWAGAGVPAENLRFLDLPQSPLNSSVFAGTKEQLRWAEEEISELLSGAKPNAAVVIPAFGESHIDHRTLRTIVLTAIEKLKRRELVVLEGPEYNRYRSLLHSPRETLLFVLNQFPLIRRLVPGGPRLNTSGFVSGPPAGRLDQSPDVFQSKLEMLKAFESQDPKQVIAFFGKHDYLRQIHHVSDALGEKAEGYFQYRDRYVGMSAVCLWITVVEVVVGLPLLCLLFIASLVKRRGVRQRLG